MLEINFWESLDGENLYLSWKEKATEEKIRMAESMIACLKSLGMKCRFVKDLNLDGLHELKTKSQHIRVYFYVKKPTNMTHIVGIGDKKDQKLDIILSYNRMQGVVYE